MEVYFYPIQKQNNQQLLGVNNEDSVVTFQTGAQKPHSEGVRCPSCLTWQSRFPQLPSAHHCIMRKQIQRENQKAGCARVSLIYQISCKDGTESFYTSLGQFPWCCHCILLRYVYHTKEVTGTLLLTDLHILYLNFTSFHLLSFFCSKVPSRSPCYIQLLRLLRLLWSATVSYTFFLLLMTFTVWSSTSQKFSEKFLNLSLSDFLNQTRIMDQWKGDHTGDTPFPCHNQNTCCQHDSVTVDVSLRTAQRQCLPDFSPAALFSSPLLPYPLETSHSLERLGKAGYTPPCGGGGEGVST